MTKQKNILVTGGAGFIGSNLVEALLKDSKVAKVKVLDNLSTGFLKNIKPFFNNSKFEFIEGDIRDFDTCLTAMENIDLVSHQAALGSVPRSIKDPITSNNVNIGGFLNILNSAKEVGVKRVVFAASSSTYGDHKGLPKVEDKIGRPLSPYAVTKYVNELYAQVFADLFGLEFIALRYFNVFGPKQDPNGAYAAVIPLFFKAAINNQSPTINGDGSYSRDFTFVANAVQANTLALFTSNPDAVNEVYNIAFGERTTLNQLWEQIAIATNTNAVPIYGPEREGDVPHSLADISKANKLLGYNPDYDFAEGINKSCNWYLKLMKFVEVD